jgi:hypothetical protein
MVEILIGGARRSFWSEQQREPRVRLAKSQGSA